MPEAPWPTLLDSATDVTDLLHARDEALTRFHCPACSGMLVPEMEDREDPFAVVRCIDCDTGYPFRKGILDLIHPAAPAAPRVRIYPYSGRTLDFFSFYEELLLLGAYRDTDLEEEVYALLGWLDPDPGSPILMLGCGRGEMAQVLAGAVPDSTLVACDDDLEELAAARVRLARRGVDNAVLVRCDLNQPPVRPAGFSCILHFGLLHALPDVETHLGRLARALPPGGRLSGVTLARSNLPRIAQAQKAMSASAGIRWVAIESLGRALMTRGWHKLTHEQPSNWMARFQAIRGAV